MQATLDMVSPSIEALPSRCAQMWAGFFEELADRNLPYGSIMHKAEFSFAKVHDRDAGKTHSIL